MAKLIIFDLNGTLANTPFVDHQPLAPLPGRKEKIAQLQAAGTICGIASNQGGVAFGYSTEDDAAKELAGIAAELGIKEWEIAFGHPKPKFGYEIYASPWHLARRKPQPGMLQALMTRLEVGAEDTMMVGDRDEDKEAAEKAGVSFQWAEDFFASPHKQILRCFEFYHQILEIDPQGARLSFYNAEGSGTLEGYGYAYDWGNYAEGIQELQSALAQARKEAEEKSIVHARAAAGVPNNDDFDPFLDADDLP